MSGLWLHVRNSPLRWALPVLIALDLAVLFLRNRHWIGVWPETGAAAQVPAYLLGILGAGAAAWAASVPTRHRMVEQLTAARVHPARLEANRLGATIVVLLIPYLIGQAVAFVVTARTFPPGLHLWLGYALLGVFVILTSVALGWTCGKLLGSVFAALTAALGFLFLIALLDRVGFVVVSGRPEMTVDPGPLAARLASITLLLLVLLWLPALSTAGRRRTLVLVPAVLPLVVVLAATSPVAERELPGDDVVCVQGSTRLCIWPEHEKYLPLLGELNARIDRLPESFVRPPLINQVGIQPTWFIGPDGRRHHSDDVGPPAFNILAGSPWSYSGDIGTALVSATLRFGSCDWTILSSSDERRLWTVEAWLESYLVGQTSPDYRTNAPAEMQEAWSKGREIASGDSLSDQFQWAAGEVDDLRGRYCHPGH
ncbi:hypothetical protein O7632_22150 [Solwaraspora sp. WMMD406]|uniref:hypothetical protein n=1 Tax=Solwaraspora sp. WMMD406 TaxID=3016095 RepID=UPI002416FA77|nr:hypothetical protein [Solwaraspora sp. WMMD406]MDG4766780.1 hypothetical protein [Solwaraspora sp. WMMD406]